jgi:hypothetical protein
MKDTDNMKDLVKIIRHQTQPMLGAYVENTEKWADAYFETQLKKSKFSNSEWAKYMGYKDGKFPSNFYNTPKAKELDKLQKETSSIVRLRKDEFIRKERQNAINHYENSVRKLIIRIEKKNLDLNNIKIESGTLSDNLNITISDGVKITKASTIFVYGNIQKPHFRYLVK